MAGFELFTEDRSLYVALPFGEKEPKSAGGGPVIARIPRPLRRNLTEWTNANERQIQLSYLMTDWTTMSGVEIERRLRTLSQMQGTDVGDPEPPELIVQGLPPGCVPFDFRHAPKLRWWVEEHVEDDGTQRNDDGRRVHVTGVITLTQVVEDETLSRLPKIRRKKGDKRPKKYTVKKGDTLQKIASKHKIKGGWKHLAKINGIRDPKRLKVGQKIRLR